MVFQKSGFGLGLDLTDLEKIGGLGLVTLWSFTLGLGIHLFVKDLDKKTAKGPFRFSSQVATCYYQSNHTKVEAIP